AAGFARRRPMRTPAQRSRSRRLSWGGASAVLRVLAQLPLGLEPVLDVATVPETRGRKQLVRPLGDDFERNPVGVFPGWSRGTWLRTGCTVHGSLPEVVLGAVGRETTPWRTLARRSARSRQCRLRERPSPSSSDRSLQPRWKRP